MKKWTQPELKRLYKKVLACDMRVRLASEIADKVRTKFFEATAEFHQQRLEKK